MESSTPDLQSLVAQPVYPLLAQSHEVLHWSALLVPWFSLLILMPIPSANSFITFLVHVFAVAAGSVVVVGAVVGEVEDTTIFESLVTSVAALSLDVTEAVFELAFGGGAALQAINRLAPINIFIM